MVSKLDRIRTSLRLGEPVTHERVSVVPLFVTEGSTLEYLTLGDAIAAELVDVDEINAGGSVPEMKVRNRAPRPVLIPDGTALVGSKQNRVVNLTILLEAESETVIPVSCVESGRWSRSGRAGPGTSSKPSSYSDKKLRLEMCRDAGASLKRSGKVSVSQSKVWGHVAGVLSAAGSGSSTEDYHAAFEDRRAKLEEYDQRLRDLEGAAGAAVLVDGKVEGIDLFDRPETFASVWPDMLRGYAMGAVCGVEAKGSETDVGACLEAVERAEKDVFAPVGIGTNLRLKADDAIGAALVHEETTVHLSVFAD